MFNGILFTFALLFVLTIVVRRFFSRDRSDLNTYLRNHEREVQSRIEAMRLETHRFDAHEALAPVEAGLNELLELHGKPEGIALDREGDALLLRSPDIRIAILWNFRTASRSSSARSGHVYGKGQWELCIGEAQPEPYTQLGSLMGRLSLLLRGMITRELHAEDFPAGGPLRPGHRAPRMLPPHTADNSQQSAFSESSSGAPEHPAPSGPGPLHGRDVLPPP